MVRNFLTVGGATFSSRVLGFVRDSMIAYAMGSGPMAEAYTVANRLANMFRRLFAEGAFATAFVPTYTSIAEVGGKERAQIFASESVSILVYVLALTTVLAELFMPQLTLLLAPGFADSPEKLDATILMGRILFPYLLLISLTTSYISILYSVGDFKLASFSQVFQNVFLICALAAILLLSLHGTLTAGLYLSVATLAGGVFQLIVVYAACRRRGIRLRLVAPSASVEVKRLYSMALPGIISGGVAQINITVGTAIASTQAGAVAWLYYADRLYQLPLGIIGITVATVILPDLSRMQERGEIEKVHHHLNRSLEFAMIFAVPATIGLMLFSKELVGGLFEYGRFSAADTEATAAVVALFGTGLPAYIALAVFRPAYFSKGDAFTPLKFSILNMGLNVMIAVSLFPFLGYLACAIATSVAAWVNFLLLYVKMRRDQIYAPDTRVIKSLWLTAIAAIVMAGGGLAFVYAVGSFEKLDYGKTLVLVGLLPLCFVAYFGALIASKTMRDQLRRKLVRKKI
ncbi:MAG: murein biosynthesis integral membrane protein MurJ [Allorhizobium sp.]